MNIVSLYPSLDLSIFKIPNLSNNNGVYSKFFLSFEDAFCFLLNILNVEKGSLILLPNFFCMNVVEGFRLKGYRCEYYILDQNLKCDISSLFSSIKQYNPRILFIFNPLGITNNVLSDISVTNNLKSDLIIIEDLVHSLIVPSRNDFVSKNHYKIDSLRKVLPILGSNLYSTEKLVSLSLNSYLNIRRFKVFILFCIWKLLLNTSLIFRNTKLFEISDKLYDFIDSEIGLKDTPLAGFFIDKVLSRSIDINKFAQIKYNNVQKYLTILKPLFSRYSEMISTVDIPASDYKNLKGFPLIIKNTDVNLLLNYLKKNKIYLWEQYPGCPWATNKNCVLLPLDGSLSDENIKLIYQNLINFYENEA